MDEKKQIEEMARIALGYDCYFDCARCAKCRPWICAEKLYAAGYRKQSVGEWKTVDETNSHKVVECTNCKEQFYFAKKGQLQIDIMPHCPNCGAKMKGE